MTTIHREMMIKDNFGMGLNFVIFFNWLFFAAVLAWQWSKICNVCRSHSTCVCQKKDGIIISLPANTDIRHCNTRWVQSCTLIYIMCFLCWLAMQMYSNQFHIHNFLSWLLKTLCNRRFESGAELGSDFVVHSSRTTTCILPQTTSIPPLLCLFLDPLVMFTREALRFLIHRKKEIERGRKCSDRILNTHQFRNIHSGIFHPLWYFLRSPLLVTSRWSLEEMWCDGDFCACQR